MRLDFTRIEINRMVSDQLKAWENPQESEEIESE
jgi:hypothetical protein